MSSLPTFEQVKNFIIKENKEKYNEDFLKFIFPRFKSDNVFDMSKEYIISYDAATGNSNIVIAMLIARIDALEEQNKDSLEKINSLEDNFAENYDSIHNLNAVVSELSVDVSKLSVKVDDFAEEVELSTDRVSKVDDSITDLNTKINLIVDNFNDKIFEIDSDVIHYVDLKLKSVCHKPCEV